LDADLWVLPAGRAGAARTAVEWRRHVLECSRERGGHGACSREWKREHTAIHCVALQKERGEATLVKAANDVGRYD
jgi:hypothetical protein